MRTPEPVVLSGHGVRLEPLGAAHAADLLVAGEADEVWRWLPLARPRDERDVLAMITDHPADVAWAVVVDGRAQGSTSYLDVDPSVDGSIRDTAFFSVLASEWPGVRDGLTARLAQRYDGVAARTAPAG